jgi:Ca-activated chloride channel family protein
MLGHQFSKYRPSPQGGSKFDQLLDLFMQLMQYTNGDVSEALAWMNQ